MTYPPNETQTELRGLRGSNVGPDSGLQHAKLTFIFQIFLVVSSILQLSGINLKADMKVLKFPGWVKSSMLVHQGMLHLAPHVFKLGG